MEKINKQQIAKIHVLLHQLGLIDMKLDLIWEASQGRAVSTKDLTKKEGVKLIRGLARLDPADRMRKKVFALAYKAGIIWGDSWEDRKMNAVKLDKFLKERGTVKKPLNQMSKEELIATVNQFEKIEKHNYQSQEKKAVDKTVEEMLSDLGIATTGNNTGKAH